jgi:hypothetical protein
MSKEETTVIENSEFSIFLKQSRKTNTPNTYTISFPCQSKPLINSIANLITKKNVLKINSDNIVFNAFSLISFKTFHETLSNLNVKFKKTIQLIQTLGQQIEYLRENENKSFYEYNLDNIVVINEDTFIYLSNNLLTLQTLKNKTTMTFNCPFVKQEFISPEIIKINCIPFTVNSKAIYFSLGILSIYFLFNQIVDSCTCQSNLLLILTPKKATKLNYLLLRCLEIEPERRSLVYL